MPEPCLRCICTKRAFIVYLKFKFRSPVACLAALDLTLAGTWESPVEAARGTLSPPTWVVHWEPELLACALRDESCWSRGRGIYRKVPSVGNSLWRVLMPREPVTTFTTGIPTFPSRVLRPRCICGHAVFRGALGSVG